ncbi:Ste3p NDAI_0A00840 [Naumovozyma dairenensis CBS 421]|uniref:STE3 n=1 Tax=Naumovozyma dairenensis (strain ATCC 10597 / BCRC 20456 / CBS 421 / NBRC 0211 / NRRL Y-12639) TaxID=1071378 RepID=G0W354_NAUDC|nr:hypothetical protein NDAI_0A00840 [Naumovozyma dairenensis CBS 421]CCD22242.1 hypothetical protein NDAI_0A00840 [Naumovozyma dairenensis CBS 421]
MSFQSSIIGLCSLAVLSLIPPLAWHSHTRNIPAIILITWLLLMNIICIVNASIWSGTDFVTRWNGEGWCDIVIKLQVGANVGISCAITNIVYNLHSILKADVVLPDLNSWTRIWKDLLISLGTPVVVMGLSYLLQVFRYGIARYNGCQNLLSPTWMTTVLYTMWMLIWSLIATVYALLVLAVFFKKRKDVKDILYCTNSGLNLTRFARLLIFCFIIVLVMFPFSLYSFVQDLEQVSGHYSFKDTHSSTLWNVIIKFDPGKPVYNIWLYVLMSYLVFVIFGLGTDALNMYARFLRTIRLGFIVDTIQGFIKKNRENRVGKLLGKMSKGTEFQTLSSSDEYGGKNCFSDTEAFPSASSPTSEGHFYVDYTLPGEREKQNKRNKNKKKNKYSNDSAFFDLEENLQDDDNNVEIGRNNYLPFLTGKYDEDEDDYDDASLSLDGFSRISYGRKNDLDNFPSYSPSSLTEYNSSKQHSTIISGETLDIREFEEDYEYNKKDSPSK